MESRNLLEIAVAAKFATLSKLLDRWHRVPILFFDVLVGWVLRERTIDELIEVFPPLVVFLEILAEVSLGRFGQNQDRWIVLGKGMNSRNRITRSSEFELVLRTDDLIVFGVLNPIPEISLLPVDGLLVVRPIGGGAGFAHVLEYGTVSNKYAGRFERDW